MDGLKRLSLQSVQKPVDLIGHDIDRGFGKIEIGTDIMNIIQLIDQSSGYCHYGKRGIGKLFPRKLDQLLSIDLGHDHIHKKNIDVACFEFDNSLLAVIGLEDFKPSLLKKVRQKLHKEKIIVYDQSLLFHFIPIQCKPD
jgi:hypothetical protein